MTSVVSISLILTLIIMGLFFSASKKEKWEKNKSSTFECGYSAYHMSRFSFSIHYLLMSLIFLFFDLELCFLMPFMTENSSSLSTMKFMTSFVLVLFMGLVAEMKSKKLEWTD